MNNSPELQRRSSGLSRYVEEVEIAIPSNSDRTSSESSRNVYAAWKQNYGFKGKDWSDLTRSMRRSEEERLDGEFRREYRLDESLKVPGPCPEGQEGMEGIESEKERFGGAEKN